MDVETLAGFYWVGRRTGRQWGQRRLLPSPVRRTTCLNEGREVSHETELKGLLVGSGIHDVQTEDLEEQGAQACIAYVHEANAYLETKYEWRCHSLHGGSNVLLTRRNSQPWAGPWLTQITTQVA